VPLAARPWRQSICSPRESLLVSLMHLPATPPTLTCGTVAGCLRVFLPQGLVAAFPKLVGTGTKQHTFVETDNCR
jgi:hypothetical protein